MANQDFQKLLVSVEAFLKEEYGFETWIGEDEGYLMLKARLLGLGECQGEAVMEVCPVSLDMEPANGMHMLQFYTTVAANINEDNILPALHALNSMNMRCPVGAFHLFEEDRQMYHKYTALLEEGESGVRQATIALSMVAETINQLFDEAILIAYDARKAMEE